MQIIFIYHDSFKFYVEFRIKEYLRAVTLEFSFTVGSKIYWCRADELPLFSEGNKTYSKTGQCTLHSRERLRLVAELGCRNRIVTWALFD